MKSRIQWWIIFAAVLSGMVFSSSSGVFAVEETGGIGMKISQLYDYTTTDEDKRGSLVVLDVFKGSPAQRFGIEKGDIILKVNEVITKQQDFRTLLNQQLRGPSFTDLKLIIWRPSIMQKFEMVIQREPMVY